MDVVENPTVNGVLGSRSNQTLLDLCSVWKRRTQDGLCKPLKYSSLLIMYSLANADMCGKKENMLILQILTCSGM